MRARAALLCIMNVRWFHTVWRSRDSAAANLPRQHQDAHFPRSRSLPSYRLVIAPLCCAAGLQVEARAVLPRARVPGLRLLFWMDCQLDMTGEGPAAARLLRLPRCWRRRRHHNQGFLNRLRLQLTHCLLLSTVVLSIALHHCNYNCDSLLCCLAVAVSTAARGISVERALRTARLSRARTRSCMRAKSTR